MKSFLDDYPLDRACDDVAKLDIYHNSYEFALFCEAAIKYVRLLLRAKYGVDLLGFCEKKDWVEYCRSLLDRHPNLDNDMAFIMVTSAMRGEVVEMQDSAN